MVATRYNLRLILSKKKMNKKFKNLVQFIKKDQNIQLAIVFGSYAKKTQMEQSDMDVAIQLSEPMTSKQKLNYMGKLQEYTRAEIDLVDLHRVGQPLLSQIMNYGKCIKDCGTQYAELAVKNVNTSQDFLPAINYIMKERRKRLLNG